MKDLPADRIAVIRASLTAFVCGIVGFLPILGLPFAVAALSSRFRVRRKHPDQWNPASVYLRVGAILSWFGLTVSVFLVILLSFFICSGF